MYRPLQSYKPSQDIYNRQKLFRLVLLHKSGSLEMAEIEVMLRLQLYIPLLKAVKAAQIENSDAFTKENL